MIFTSLSVITEVGKAHGMHPKDIYGCLHFFLSENLWMFARRLCKFNVNFKVFPFKACNLSDNICQNVLAMFDIPASIYFDCIIVSNILDANYVGLRGVLTHWAPLLAETSTAAIVGYFMNLTEDGQGSRASRYVSQKLMKSLLGQVRK